MSHIFGLSHSFSGLVDQASGFLTGGYSGFANTGNQAGFVPVPGVVDSTFGAGTGAVAATPVVSGGSCGPVCGPKIKRYITTVCPDGTTTVREQKSRKRRRRIATVSDIKDLASLKTVLGGGKAFESWIATRGR